MSPQRSTVPAAQEEPVPGSPRHFSRQLAVATALLSLVLTSAACGGDDDDSLDTGAPTPTSNAPTTSALAAKVPDAIKSDGKIVVGTDATYAPNEFLDEDGKTVIGFDVDLFNAVAQKLGLEAEYVPAPFDNIIPSVQSNKYEIGVSSFTRSEEHTSELQSRQYL